MYTSKCFLASLILIFLSGIGLLLKIMRQFEGVYEKKQFYFIKNGQVGWISAFVNQTIAENK